MWRTGSTYVWKKFRDDARYRAYYEPLHERLIEPRERVERLCGAVTMAALRHPPTENFYFAEYPFAPEGGVEHFKKSLSYERYCLEPGEADGDLRRYIGNLCDCAERHGQRAVFQFNRSLFRAAWLAHNFPSVNVLVLRNPLGVWKSFRSFAARYFQTGICRIIGQNRERSPLRHLPRWLEFPSEVRVNAEEEAECYRPFAERNDALLYPTFFDFYLLSTVHCAQHADCILDLDEITQNPAARHAAADRLRELGIEIDLDDCSLPVHKADGGDAEWLAYENFSGHFLAATLPLAISISRRQFSANAPLLGSYFRDLLAKFVERRAVIWHAPEDAQKSDKHRIAIRLFSNREYELSAEFCGAALTQQPASGELWNDWATAQTAAGRPHLAELGFRVALRCNPPDHEATGNLGVLLLGAGRFSEALPLLEAAELEANDEMRPIVSDLANRARQLAGRDAPQEQAPAVEMPAGTAPGVRPARDKGFVVFLTGLSGAGKTTIADALRKLLGGDDRQVTSLDGDVVRKYLSSELGFSKEHRDLNVRRIGFVAAQIARSGGIAICSCIAPYDAVRREVRTMIEPEAGFFLVHVATPLAVCEQRDVKGLYARARAGLLPQFTGISDPYEVPADAEVTIDTRRLSPNDAAREILGHISRRGYFSSDASLARQSTPVTTQEMSVAS